MLSTATVFSERLVVVVSSSLGTFAVLQSRMHDVWARLFGSTLKDDLLYTPSDCFETFPFPAHWESNEDLERIGCEYYDCRAALMVRNNEGLTKTYNRFHDPDERDSDMLALRNLHAAMDRAVLDAYGWTDIQPRCQFILDYEDEDDDTPGQPSAARSPGATAGQTRSATRCWAGYSNSMPGARRKSRWPAAQRERSNAPHQRNRNRRRTPTLRCWIDMPGARKPSRTATSLLCYPSPRPFTPNLTTPSPRNPMVENRQGPSRAPHERSDR